MIAFNAPVLLAFVQDLVRLELHCGQHPERGDVALDADDQLSLRDFIQRSAEVSQFFSLPATEARRSRLVQAVDSHCRVSELQIQIRMLREALEDELGQKLIVFVSPSRARYLEPQLFGPQVEAAFPRVAEDVAEAGKCIVASAYTACVFHLMRVLEVGVQELARAVGVDGVENLQWSEITGKINAALRNVPKTDPRRQHLHAAGAHLDLVRVAWRNEVMHPKATYTEDEATTIFLHAASFMQTLATVVE